MKVLLINGSPHANGNTYLALTEVANTLNECGIETELVHIGVKPIRSCIACGRCKEIGENRCVFDDDICNSISAKMRDSDGLVIGSPVYYGQPNGALLSLIQRMFYSAGSLFKRKPAASVAVCRRGGATAAYQTMNMPFEMMNMPVIMSQYWNIVYGRDAGEASLDAEGMQTMRTLARNMAWMIKKIHASDVDYPEDEPRQGMNFIR